MPQLVSVFRCPELNKAVGGSESSDHCKGSVGDIDGDAVGVSNYEVYEFIEKNLVYDQLIFEFPDKNGKPSWVHASYREIGNRRMKLIAVKEGGKTIYKSL